MKATGIVRKLDRLGRIVVPKELRETFGLKEGSSIEVFVDGNDTILREYKPCCVFCGEAGDTVLVSGKRVCQSCLKQIRSL